MDNQIMESLAKSAGIDISKKIETPTNTSESADSPVVENSVETRTATNEATSPSVTTEVKVESKEDKISTEKTESNAPVVSESQEVKKETPSEKAWYESEEPSTTKSTKKEKEAAIDYAAKVKEYEQLLSDPELEALVAAKKTGKGIKDIYNDVVGQDIDSLAPRDIYETELKKIGLQGDDLSELMAEFDALPKGKQLLETNDMRNQLKQQQAEKLKKFTADSSAEAKRQAEIAQRTIQEADAYSKSLIGQKKFGVEITPEMANDVKTSVAEGIKELFNEDGSLNLPAFSEAVLWIKHHKTIVKANISQATNKGKEEILNEVSRPNRNETSIRVPTENAKVDKLAEASKQWRQSLIPQSPIFTKTN